MSAPGIQLGSEPHFSYFQPDVREYLQKLEQAVVSNNLAAARHAYAQLQKSVDPSTPHATNRLGAQASAQVSAELQTIGKALESGQLSEAGDALRELRKTMTANQVPPQSRTSESEPANGETASETEHSSDSRPNLNVRA